MADWPDDADGDVMRGLAERGFDFDATCTVDFSVDFARWPPRAEALDLLRDLGEVVIEDGEDRPYVVLQIASPLSHAFVTATQRQVNRLMAPFGGGCDAWGVLG